MERGLFDAVLMEHEPRVVAHMLEKRILPHAWDEEAPMQPLPAGIADGVPPDVYSGYRLGRDSACADVILVTNGGVPAVLLSKRKESVCFGGKWWHHGGAVLSYASLTGFVADRAQKECGIASPVHALLGVYRTCAGDHIGSTLQPCYMAVVPRAALEEKALDSGHTDIRLFTDEELKRIPEGEQHWYPMRVAELALASLR